MGRKNSGYVTKERNSKLHEKTMLTDLIAAEFKYHDKCRKDMIREDRETPPLLDGGQLD